MFITSIQFPIAIHIGHVDILLHNIFEPLSFFIGFRYFLWLRKKQGDIIDTSNRVWILIGAIFGSFFGSRLVAAFENPEQLFQAKNTLQYIYQNKTILGGLLGGLAGVELIKLAIAEKNPSGNLMVYPILLSMIIGRIGCFSMGVYEATYGLQTDLPWGMYLGDEYLRHPVTLYEMLFLILLWFSLKIISKKRYLTPGALFKIFLFSYCVFRFFLDFIKPHVNLFFVFSSVQIAALCGIMYYYRYIVKPRLLFEERNQNL